MKLFKILGMLSLTALMTISCHRTPEAVMITISNHNGMSATFTNYGARLTSLVVPASDGTFKDVVWGYDTVEEYYASNDLYCGPIVGRYGNRIGKGKFVLDGKEYSLTINDGENHLHGGTGGLSTKIWTMEKLSDREVKMSILSPDGEEGYPGNVEISVFYTINYDNSLDIKYEAVTDAPTILNLTSHAYFNLHGTSNYSTNSHILRINAGHFIPTDESLIPTGEIASVEGTPLDFRIPTAIGERIDDTSFEAIAFAGGYDHNWVLDKEREFSLAAEVFGPSTGIVMQVWTDQPGLQFYSGNFMDGKDIGHSGDIHGYRTGIALETQNYPDAPNHPDFPSPVLKPGEIYKHLTRYSFSLNAF
ncbi:MAG TPA: aldose epimerase family protein [Bacteroidales bacterium]|jgi:aldose 1-epimerase|nr:galactose mutarotase [Bacteroidales bacterium]HKM13030.1 aldose epimerase family protein [Bacteroidales bacterium]HPB88835.1 aldose epimerase family protein [Bacteroidales bacterium]HPY22346.1 aldose epimerase family protein [Bacteroidales bacterium]HQA93066.1 aldose epimerase family protein [Bacteroidales bacterium]